MFKGKESGAVAGSKEQSQYITGLPLVILFLAICLNAVLIILYLTALGTAIPSITTYFGTVEDVDWYSTAYMLALCAVQPLTGQIYNIFRAKATFLTFIGTFALGTLVSALSRTSKAFIVGRAIGGLGAGGLFNGAMVIITVSAPPAIRPQLLSISVVMVGIGGVVGPVMGGALTEHLGWRWCLWIFLPPAGLIAFIFFLQRIPDQAGLDKSSAVTVARQIHHKLDLIGFSLFTPATVMFLLAVSWGGSKHAWDSATTIGLLCGSAATLVLFCAWIRHYKDRAMLPPRILLKPVIMYGCIISFMQGGSFIMLQQYLPLWFQSVKGASPQKGGLMMLPTCVTQIITGMGCSALLKTIPYAPIWSLFGNAAVAIGSGLMTTFGPNASLGQWIGYQVLQGVGRGIAMQMPILAAQAVLPESEISIATASLLFFQYFGATFLNCIAKTIFINSLGPALSKYAPHIDRSKVIGAGATEVLKLVAPQDVEGVKLAYNKALTTTFWLPTAFGIAGFVFSYGLGWQRIGVKKGKKANQPGTEEGSEPVSIDGETKVEPKAAA